METTPNHIPIKDFNARYRPIRKTKDTLLGETSLLKDMTLQRTVIVKDKEISTPRELEEEIKSCELLTKLNAISAFAHLYGYTYKTAIVNKAEVCLFSEIREYVDNDLEREVTNRLRTQHMFTEHELWKFTKRTIQALAKLQNHNTYHGNIRPKTILLTKEGDCKIYWTHYHPTAYAQLLENAISLDSRCVFPPEILDSYGKGNVYADYNPLFSDVFSLGLTLLYASTLGDIDEIYDWEKLTIKPNKLNFKLTWVKATYSERLYKLMERMLQIDPCTRHDFQSLTEYITVLNHGKDGHHTIDLSSSGLLKTSPTQKFLLSTTSRKKLLLEQSEAVFEPNNDFYGNIAKTGSPLRSVATHEANLPVTIRASGNPKALQFLPGNVNSNVKQSIKEEENLSQEKEKGSTPRLLKRTFSPLKAPNNRDNGQILKEITDEILKKPGITRKQYLDGSYYEGQFVGVLREGYGIYHYNYNNNGDIYAGTWKDDKFHGRGIYLFANGERYEGDLQYGQKHGKGVYYYTNKNKYMGDWKNNKKSGIGIFYFYASNEVYDGEWLDGERQGQGTFYFANGDMFVGTWVRGEKRGKGSIIYYNGARFEGDWNNNKPNGHGIMTYTNGDKYDGNWVNGMKSGFGTYYYPDGSRYEGDWANDNKEGHGVFTYSGNEKYTGQWSNGYKHGVGVYEYSNGSSYRGEWQKDLKHGRGIMTMADGTKYEGNWEAGEKSGKGMLRLANGDFYEGDFKEDLMHGIGKYKWVNGDVYEGEWVKGMMHGEGTVKGRDGTEKRKVWEYQIPGLWNGPGDYSGMMGNPNYTQGKEWNG